MVIGSGGGGLIAKSWSVLWTPRTVAHQASLSKGFPKQEYWSELSFPSPGIFLTQGSNPVLQVDSLLTEPLGKPISKLSLLLPVYVLWFLCMCTLEKSEDFDTLQHSTCIHATSTKGNLTTSINLQMHVIFSPRNSTSGI